MRKTTLRQLGLGSCMFLAVFSGMPVGTHAVRAQTNPTGTTGGATTAGIGTSGTIPTLSPQQFLQNPSSLFQNSTALGANVTSLIQQGVSPNTISQVLGSAGGGLNTNQWSSVLGNLASGQNINPQAAASLINGAFGGQLPPQIASVLSNVNNLGNITSIQGLTNLLGNNTIQNVLGNLNALQAGQAIDQILQGALGGSLNLQSLQNLATQAGMQALTGAISQAAPQLANLLGAGGIQQALNGALNSIAGTAIGQALGGALGGAIGGALAGGLGSAVGSALGIGGAAGTCGCTTCVAQIPQHHNRIRTQVTDDFNILRRWTITQFFMENLLPAMMLMADQLTVAGVYQVEIIGAFLDAKHQLETQRLFQQLTARAHKDYHPSEGMCTFGTTVRSLAMSDRKADMAATAVATRMMQRQALNGEAISYQGADSDKRSRLQTYISTYCDQADNQNGLIYLCRNAVPDPARRNIDIDYTRNIESRLTLDMEFADIQAAANANNGGGGGGGNSVTTTVTPDEQDVFALAANLYSHNVVRTIEAKKLGDAATDRVRVSAAQRYLDLRSIFAKRSVAQNSFAALVAMRTAGDPESAPYVKAVMRELGVSDDQEIEKLLGKNPSYFAQMEVLTKKLYQNPVFYTELYDKPVNIERKGAALQAIGLMQDRDLFNSLLRSEAVLSVLLETELIREQEKVANQKGRINPAGGAR